MQEPYYDIERQIIINHFNFQNIISKISKIKLRVVTYVAKYNLELQCTYKTDLINDSNLQILSISNNNIKETYLINVYNEKKQESNQEINQYTVNRVLTDLNLLNKTIILAEDMNYHHNW